jgi:hypothetical protein
LKLRNFPATFRAFPELLRCIRPELSCVSPEIFTTFASYRENGYRNFKINTDINAICGLSLEPYAGRFQQVFGLRFSELSETGPVFGLAK